MLALIVAQQLTASIVRDLHKLNLSVDFFAASVIILEFGFYFVWVVVAFVIFWRKSNDWMALLVALFLVLFPATQSLGSPGDVGTAYPSLHVLTTILDDLGWIMLLLFFFLFPDGRFVPRWTAWGALGYVLVNMIGDLFPNLPFNGVISFFLGLPLLALVSRHWLVFAGLSLYPYLQSNTTSADQVGAIRCNSSSRVVHRAGLSSYSNSKSRLGAQCLVC